MKYYLLADSFDEEFDNPKEFIRIYSNAYFTYVPRDIEKEAIDIFDKGITSTDDVLKIMEWKFGRNKFITNEELTFPRLKVVFTQEYADRILAAQKKYDENKRIEELFTNITCDENEGIGTTYAITLVNFITHGEWPMYDRFSKLALDTIGGECLLKDYYKQKMIEPPDKSNYAKVDKYVHGYIGDLERVFKSPCDKRNVDRALWTYGHLINKIILNKVPT